MFGFSISHLILIAIVVLIFVGPKQLPEVARTIAKLLRDLRGFSDDFTSTLNQLSRENPPKDPNPPVTTAPHPPNLEGTPWHASPPAIPPAVLAVETVTEHDPLSGEPLSVNPEPETEVKPSNSVQNTVSTQRPRRSTEEKS